MDIAAQSADILANLHLIRQRIAAAAAKAGRSATDIQLLLATKTVAAENIKVAADAGATLLGENKVQELKEKDYLLGTLPVQRHFIGHLQTNKIKDVLKYVTCIQSVDRQELAEKLDSRLQYEKRTMDVFVQVNTSFEESKFGVHPDEAIRLLEQVKSYGTLQVKGLMTIGLFDADPEKVRPSFRLLREIRDTAIQQKLLSPDAAHLSMGMSGDLETAIEEGATIIRVGTAVFGKRQYPDSYYWNEQGQ
ncbi:YggS family pyridoxal phosphate-dependent enzyme [Chitinophaga rhizophila]|uniref:Pyridoxal phosphate homeostasis protein n=1 Tax=Chitinophaga rhizophila TaxID=2866212 RepID=A0ABS7G6M9_9BACT|nr:YggS family pyridoxal phosphate-dependent enzyme [Chitinophaga rhizophila]MBW8682820.1 YggS family pyridoxal phosphate-dependent enzyme [Chitinophaga rhizophila]